MKTNLIQWEKRLPSLLPQGIAILSYTIRSGSFSISGPLVSTVTAPGQKVVLPSSIVFIAVHHGQILSLLDEDRAAIAGPILVELIQGTQTAEEKETIKTLIRGIHWLSVSDEHWHKAAEMAFALRRKGVTGSVIDTLIAILAIDYRCILLHKDSHFELIARNSSLKCYQ